MSTPAATLEAKLNVQLAQTRRLVTSWLPPPTASELASQKTDEQLAKEDEELFAPTPPRYVHTSWSSRGPLARFLLMGLLG